MKKSLFNLKFAFENRPVSDAPRLAILYSGKIPGIVPWQGNRNRLWVCNNKHRALSWPLLHLPPLNPDLSLGPSRFNMGRGQLCLLFLVLCMILISLGLILTSIVTDYWYNVQNSNSNTTVANTYSYSFGMWRKCYTKDVPKDVPYERRVNKCAYTYQDLVPRTMPSTEEGARYLHLERAWVGCAIASAGIQIFAILTMICGLWPADCANAKRSTLYLVTSILCLIAAMCGITSGICFIALRDLDSSSRNIYPNGTTTLYDFSFMMEWASNSLCILEGFIFLCLLKMDYNDITETGKYNSFMWFCSGKKSLGTFVGLC